MKNFRGRAQVFESNRIGKINDQAKVVLDFQRSVLKGKTFYSSKTNLQALNSTLHRYIWIEVSVFELINVWLHKCIYIHENNDEQLLVSERLKKEIKINYFDGI